MNKLISAAILCLFCHSAFAVDLDFYVYGDFDATAGAFTRAALIFADADYAGLFFVACVFGIFSGGITMFWTGLWGQLDAGKLIQYIFYPIMGVTLYVTLIIQTGTLHIFDETQNKYRAVGGIPDGIVLVAGAFNKFERIISEVASDNPATVRSSLASGTGIKLFLDAFATSPLTTAPELQKSLNNLIIDCVDMSMLSNVDLDLEYIRSTAPNARAVLLEIDNSAVSTTVYDNNGVPTIMTCDLASAAIVASLDALNIDEQTESLCLDAGYEVGGANAAAERAACYTQLENVAAVFMGPAFGNTTRELFTNIAVYNVIATNINDANVVVNGLGSREIASEGIATLAVTEDWLPQIRGAMLVIIVSMMVLISLFLVTPLFGKALKVTLALFFFLAFWGASSSMLLMAAYDQVVYASRSIGFHAGGLEAYLLAPTTAISALAIIGDSLSTAMMIAAALTTIFTGVSAYGLSNALAHAAGKVEGIGENQGRNLTPEGKADVTERNANAYATNTVSGSMSAEQYGSAHIQRASENNYSAFGRAEGIQQQGGVSSQVSHAEGLQQGGAMVPTSELANPAQFGSDSSNLKIGSTSSQINRADQAGIGSVKSGAESLENVRNSSTSATLTAHNGSIEAVDKTTATEAQQSKGHAEGLRNVTRAGGSSPESVGHRAGVSYGADHMTSKENYRTAEQVIAASQATGAYKAGELKTNIQDAKERYPEESTNQAMRQFGQDAQALSNNPLIASGNFERGDLITAEETSNVERIANSRMLQAIAGEFFNPNGGAVETDELIRAAQSESPLRSLAVPGHEMIEKMDALGYGHLSDMVNPDEIVELSAAMTLNEQDGSLQFGNTTVSQGASVILSDKVDARSGANLDMGDKYDIRDEVSGTTLMNAVQSYDENPTLLNKIVDSMSEMSPSDLLQVSEEFNGALPTPFEGRLSTSDSYSFTAGTEGHFGLSSPQIMQGVGGIDAGIRGVTNQFNDNVDTRDTGASVKMGGIQIYDKLMEIQNSNLAHGDVADEPTRLNIGPTEEEVLKTQRMADYFSTVFQSSFTEGRTSINVDNVKEVNDDNSGKTGNLLREINKAETELYRAKGWETGTRESVPTPQIRAAQEKQLAEQAALQKKVEMYRLN